MNVAPSLTTNTDKNGLIRFWREGKFSKLTKYSETYPPACQGVDQ
jgi:hypothetical protein